MARASASVDHITLLRDFIAWEPRPLLRKRARTILERMESEAEGLLADGVGIGLEDALTDTDVHEEGGETHRVQAGVQPGPHPVLKG